MTRREKQWIRILSTSLLDAAVPSDEVSSNSDCENRTVARKLLETTTCRFLAWPVAIDGNENGAGTQIGVPICITRSNGCLRW